MKLIRNMNRGVLSEGRTSGISFALCKRSGNIFEEIMPLSACKDYMNDAIWAENVNKTSPSVYGFSHKPVGILKKAKFVYLSTGMLTSDRSAPPTHYNLEAYLQFIHQIEQSLGLVPTKVHQTDEYPVLQIDKYWSQYPYLISMYGLFFRSGGKFKEGNNLETFLKSLAGYGGIGQRAIDNYKFLIDNDPPLQPWDRAISNVHNHGIKTTNLSILHENQASTKI